MRSGEKLAHRLREIPQRLPLHGLRASREPVVLGTDRSQLGALLVVMGRATPGLPMQFLLDGQIPRMPSMATVLGEQPSLVGSRSQPVSRHARNLAATTDKMPKGDTAFPPPAAAGGFHVVAEK